MQKVVDLKQAKNNTFMTSSKKRTRCTNCRRLKIGCSKERPSCEYCLSTGRYCAYDEEVEGRLKTNENTQVLAKQMEIWKNQASLNSAEIHLAISRFELRLLSFFHHEFALRRIVKNKPKAPDTEVWVNEVPQLWQQSQLVKHNIFMLSTILMWNKCDLSICAIDDADQEYFSTSSDPLDIVSLGKYQDVKGVLYQRSLDYYYESIQHSLALIKRISAKDQGAKMSPTEAAEVIISSMLLFTFMGLQPHGLIPLISFDDNSPSMVSLCRSMKLAMMRSYPWLWGTSYEPLLYLFEVLNPPSLSEDDKYPLLQHLQHYFDHKIDKNAYSLEQLEAIARSLHLWSLCICNGIQLAEVAPFSRWIFCIRFELYQMMLDQDFFALKLLFYYACISLLVDFGFANVSNLFLDYAVFFKQYNYNIYGGWEDDMDARLFDIVCVKGLKLSKDSYSRLATFNPLHFS